MSLFQLVTDARIPFCDFLCSLITAQNETDESLYTTEIISTIKMTTYS